MIRLLIGTLSLFAGYHGLLVLTPLYLADLGADELVIGIATGAFMLLAVSGHIAAPAVVSRWGTRRPFIVVLVGTSIAAVAHLFTAASIPILVLSAVRGATYGIGAVVSATAVAHLALPSLRVGALARYGFAAALPGLVASTAVVFLAQEISFHIAFLTVAVLTLLAVPLLLELGAPDTPPTVDPKMPAGRLGPASMSIAVVFAGFAMVYGAALTFVPVQLHEVDEVAYPFVLATALGLAAFRWAGGAAVRRWNPGAILGVGLVLGCLAMSVLALLPVAVAPLAGLMFGAGFGLAGTATHSVLTTSTEWASLGKANAIFNVAWSGGMGVGATAFGAIATAIGVAASYSLAAGWHALLAMALIAWFVASSQRGRPDPHRPR